MSMKKIGVIGSLNMDLVATAERFPRPGETLVGKDFRTFPGGKGANQAVAVARLGADVALIGKIGDDLFGAQYRAILKKEGVRSVAVKTVAGVPTGIAVIEVNGAGENHILIIPGANGRVDRKFIDSTRTELLRRDIFLLQLEIPIPTVLHAVKLLKRHGKTVILDPAPARRIPDELIAMVDYITPNETELEILAGQRTKSSGGMRRAAEALLAKGAGTVIAKAGSRGAFIVAKDRFLHVPAYEVQVVDTTAAGDSFNAGFAVALAKEKSVEECVAFANAVAAVSVTAMGAQDGMPGMKEVERLRARRIAG